MTRDIAESKYPLDCVRQDMVLLAAKITGGGAGDPTMGTVQGQNGAIQTITRTGVGTYNVVFRHFYPILKTAPWFSFTGTLPLTGRCSAIDYTVNPPTATFVFSVGAFETDIPTTDSVDITWIVRNSTKNP